jgi:hypothetical protein
MMGYAGPLGFVGLLSLVGCGSSSHDGSQQGAGGSEHATNGGTGAQAGGGSSGGGMGGARAGTGGEPGGGQANGGSAGSSVNGGFGGATTGGTSGGGTGGASAASGQAGMSATAGESGGAQGPGRDPPSTCSMPGACDAATCDSGTCFDEDHCATSATRYWGAEWHEQGQSVAIGPGDTRVLVGSTLLGNTNDSNQDVFIAEFSPDGNELWSKQWGSPATESASAVLVDASGNAYLGGWSAGDTDGETNAGRADGLLVKFDSAGNRLWTRLIGDALDDSIRDLAFDADGNVITAGVWGSDYDSQQTSAFIAKVSPDGEVLDRTTLDFPVPASGATVDVDSDGNLLVSGVTFEPFLQGHPFVQKLAPEGDVVWTARWDTDAGAAVYSAVLDRDENLVVTGITAGSIGGDPPPSASSYTDYATSVTPDGDVAWIHTYGDVDMRAGPVALAKNGDLLLGGTVLGALTESAMPDGFDIYFMRLCPDGTVKSVEQWSLGDDDYGYGVAEDSQGQVILSGKTRRDPDLGGGSHYYDAFLITVSPE